MKKQYSLIIVYHNIENKVLMCRRTKEPYKGLLNFVGGRIEDSEDALSAAYRELCEETSITKNDIELRHLMTNYYALSNIELHSFVGKLINTVNLKEEINPLLWISEDTDFFDMSRFAGEGNIGHLIEQTKYYKTELFK